MWKILKTFFEDFLDNLVNAWLSALSSVIENVANKAFFFETLFGDNLTFDFQSAFDAVYLICATALVLKLLWKGWKTYIMWDGGDPEVSPTELLKGAGKAIVATVAFPLLYEIGIHVALEIVQTVLVYFRVDGLSNTSLLILAVFNGVDKVAEYFTFSGILFVILYIVLLFTMLKNGAELLVFRLGVPIAAIGLVNSDGGAWNSYVQMLLKQVFTIMVQYFCVVGGVAVFASNDGIMTCLGGIALLLTAFSAPTVLSQVLMPKSGGGITQKVTTVATVVRTFAAVA